MALSISVEATHSESFKHPISYNSDELLTRPLLPARPAARAAGSGRLPSVDVLQRTFLGPLRRLPARLRLAAQQWPDRGDENLRLGLQSLFLFPQQRLALPPARLHGGHRLGCLAPHRVREQRRHPSRVAPFFAHPLPRRAGGLQIHQLLYRQPAHAHRRRRFPPRQPHAAPRIVVLHLPHHQLRRRRLPEAHRPRAIVPRLSLFPLLLPLPHRRPDRKGRPLHAAAHRRRPSPARRPCTHLRRIFYRPDGRHQEGRHRRLPGAVQQHRFRQPVRLLGRRASHGRFGIWAADLLRLLGLQRYGHRAGRHPRLRSGDQLRFPLPLAKRHRVLASVAHLALSLASGLPLHPTRWQPSGRGKAVCQPTRDHAPRRTLARRRVDVHRLGRRPRRRPLSAQAVQGVARSTAGRWPCRISFVGAHVCMGHLPLHFLPCR